MAGPQHWRSSPGRASTVTARPLQLLCYDRTCRITPKLTIEMIEVLEETFALFVSPEKPQVSPWPAASFIKKGTIVYRSDTAVVKPCHLRTRQRPTIDGRIPLFILHFFAIPTPMGPRESPTRASLERAFLATGWRRSSSRHASATSSIW